MITVAKVFRKWWYWLSKYSENDYINCRNMQKVMISVVEVCENRDIGYGICIKCSYQLFKYTESDDMHISTKHKCMWIFWYIFDIWILLMLDFLKNHQGAQWAHIFGIYYWHMKKIMCHIFLEYIIDIRKINKITCPCYIL